VRARARVRDPQTWPGEPWRTADSDSRLAGSPHPGWAAEPMGPCRGGFGPPVAAVPLHLELPPAFGTGGPPPDAVTGQSGISSIYWRATYNCRPCCREHAALAAGTAACPRGTPDCSGRRCLNHDSRIVALTAAYAGPGIVNRITLHTRGTPDCRGRRSPRACVAVRPPVAAATAGAGARPTVASTPIAARGARRPPKVGSRGPGLPGPAAGWAGAHGGRPPARACPARPAPEHGRGPHPAAASPARFASGQGQTVIDWPPRR
jgi:hypothetical protein